MICLDYDFSVIDWGDRFQSYRDRRKKMIIPGSQRLMQNQAWVPMYDGDGDILAREYGVGPEADKIKLDPVLEGVSIDELMDAIPDWQA
jgi:hypothetical protein